MLIDKMNINSLSGEDFALWLGRMPEKKQAEVISYRREEDKKRSVCGYRLAVKTLSKFLKTGEEEITLSYEESGKPVCSGAHLSISHAGDYAVCAVSDKLCGIDAEVMRKVSLRAALRVCTKAELRYIFGDDFDGDIPKVETYEMRSRFLEIWTKKEAFGKMLGKGIAYDMKNTDVTYIKTWHDGELIISAVEMG